MDIDLTALRALAEKATPGKRRSAKAFKWRVLGPPHADGGDYAPIADNLDEADAAYIAALSPDVVLELVALARVGQRIVVEGGYSLATSKMADAIRAAAQEAQP